MCKEKRSLDGHLTGESGKRLKWWGCGRGCSHHTYLLCLLLGHRQAGTCIIQELFWIKGWTGEAFLAQLSDDIFWGGLGVNLQMVNTQSYSLQTFVLFILWHFCEFLNANSSQDTLFLGRWMCLSIFFLWRSTNVPGHLGKTNLTVHGGRSQTC